MSAPLSFQGLTMQQIHEKIEEIRKFAEEKFCKEGTTVRRRIVFGELGTGENHLIVTLIVTETGTKPRVDTETTRDKDGVA